MDWIDIKNALPEDGQRIIAYVPNNKVYLPGKMGETKLLPVIFLTLSKDFFKEGTEKREKYGPHFWLGEGQSNQYFDAVTHWMPVPQSPYN